MLAGQSARTEADTLEGTACVIGQHLSNRAAELTSSEAIETGLLISSVPPAILTARLLELASEPVKRAAPASSSTSAPPPKINRPAVDAGAGERHRIVAGAERHCACLAGLAEAIDHQHVRSPEQIGERRGYRTGRARRDLGPDFLYQTFRWMRRAHAKFKAACPCSQGNRLEGQYGGFDDHVCDTATRRHDELPPKRRMACGRTTSIPIGDR